MARRRTGGDAKDRKRTQACKTLGIPADSDLYGAQAAASALGVSVGTIRKYVIPSSTAPNPKYPNAGAPVGIYDPIDLVAALKNPAVAKLREGYSARRLAALQAVETKTDRMEEQMGTVKITIVEGKSKDEIRHLAQSTHGGNYRGEVGEFRWSNRAARNCIRHNLTNYEELWDLCNRGETGEPAFRVLRERVDELIATKYPEFAEDDEAPSEGPGAVTGSG